MKFRQLEIQFRQLQKVNGINSENISNYCAKLVPTFYPCLQTEDQIRFTTFFIFKISRGFVQLIHQTPITTKVHNFGTLWFTMVILQTHEMNCKSIACTKKNAEVTCCVQFKIISISTSFEPNYMVG